MKKVKSKLRDNTFFIVDGSQAFPNLPVNMEDL
jgi:selenocysteine lyase/cysteine desulfurase